LIDSTDRKALASVGRDNGDLQRNGDLEPMGVVDIGSNSVRLVVYEGAVRSPTPIFNEKVLCGLGRQVGSTGRLGEDSVRAALEALTRFRAVTRILGVKNVRAIATAACRDAADGPEFIARGERALGTKIQVLSGQREAELAANGIMMGFRSPDGLAGDLGGGSLELIEVEGEALRRSATLPLGGLRLLDASNDKIERAIDIADDEIAHVPWIDDGRNRTFYAVGGTWRAIARLHMEKTGYPLHVMHGYTMATEEAIEFCEEIRKAKKLSGLPGIEEISRPRREVLPYGALVLERLLKRLGPSAVDFSVFGIREGLVYSLMSEAERRKDPLLSFCAEYARARSRSADHAFELCVWSDALFEPPGPRETEEERRLRHAACLLSDISWRAHPDYRGEQSLILIAHAALGGIDHPGRVFLALASYFRHIGISGDAEAEDKDMLSERLKAIVSKKLYRRARIVGAAIRAAHMLSIGRPGIIDETPLSYERTKLVLTVPKAYAALDGERLRRRFATLAGLLEREPEIRVKG
jgi:exopolyphosphatase / guanosine-5'-triphosphate,3'-diphosphate pyrophosphatase